ncbi:bleomycin resistance protein [Planctomonas sp. JC2975]|uniref:VOC family protein n=1 Tax=Planctomonas sp. JC2975 TaxID=2729626 RepID=UPI001474B167|nr:VOC family protein [Planctomonas sp. JC2975]NNC13755.1 bleomycin resistance protein [Planctomonas sp. JC2975]
MIEPVQRSTVDEALLLSVDAVMLAVSDLDAGIAFYRDGLGHQLRWRNDEIGQAALACQESRTEIVLTTRLQTEPNWLVRDAVAAAQQIEAAGGRILEPRIEIPVGCVSIVEDPFGNRLVLVDLSKGRYDTDDAGTVTGVQSDVER